jgi:NTP pyrophosphatase (non-canonical NTP hydrolase)
MTMNAKQAAERVAGRLEVAFPEWSPDDRRLEALLKLGEESGEALGAGLRLMGRTRRSGTYVDLAYELADAVISAYRVALTFGIDLETAIEEKAKIVTSRGVRAAERVEPWERGIEP